MIRTETGSDDKKTRQCRNVYIDTIIINIEDSATAICAKRCGSRKSVMRLRNNTLIINR